MGYLSHYSKWHNHQDPKYINYIKRKFARAFEDYLPMDMNAAILEIGSANGMALYTLRGMGYTNLLGIEVDAELAQIAQSFSLPVIIEDAEVFIKKASKKYDFIFLFDVLEHFEKKNIPQILKDLYHILNENGKLMLIVPNAASSAGQYFRYIDWTHQVSFTSTSISYLLEESGFKDIIISDESLIEVPVKEDFETDEAYYNAKVQSENARFHEAFSRWEMTCMFGSNPLNLLVSPNMKVVACKRNRNNVNLKIDIKNNELFDLQEIYKRVVNNELQLEEVKNRLTIDHENLSDLVSTSIKVLESRIMALESSVKIQNENMQAQDLQQLLVVLDIEKYSLDIKMIREENKRLEQSIFIFHKQAALQKQKNIWAKIMFKFKSYKLRRLVKNSDYFDRDYYLNNNYDVRERGVDPILHYLSYGAYEGRNPSEIFNTDDYFRSHPEVLLRGINPLVHMINKEKNTGRL